MARVAALVQTRDALREAFRDGRQAWNGRWTIGAATVAVAALLPTLPLELGFDRVASDLYLGAAAVGLGIVVGLGGLPSLGHGAFVAVGAFGVALLTVRWGWPAEAAIVAATALAGAAGGALGLALGYLRPAIVAVVTWLLAWLVALALLSFPSLSGGAQGLVLDDELRLSATAHYELALGLAALAVVLFALLKRAPAGIALVAARERRPTAEGLGAPVARLRAVALGLGSAVAGLAGALAVHLAGVADAGAYGPILSFELFVAVVLGGAISPIGGLVGVAVLAVLDRVTEVGDLETLQASRIETLLAAAIVLSALGATDRGLVPALADQLRRSAREPRPRGSAAPAAPPAVAPASVSARGLTKRFGELTAVQALELELDGGSVHALIGPNGSGKTTALRLLAGTLDADTGTVRIDETVTPAGVRAAAGIVATSQATSVFAELTALDNALVGAQLSLDPGAVRSVLATPKARRAARAARDRARAALAVVGLAGAADVPAGELPGAEQRRLMIAAALATQPRALLLDEPAAGASREEVDALAGLIGSLRASGLAILLVEHNLRLVRRVADRVTVLDAGREVVSGTQADVLGSDAVLRSYLGRRS
jgi:branched-chain amino acid transport system permease protein